MRGCRGERDVPHTIKRSLWEICGGKVGTGSGFSPSISVFHSQYDSTVSCILFVISVLLLPERQADEAWEPSKKFSFGYGGKLNRTTTFKLLFQEGRVLFLTSMCGEILELPGDKHHLSRSNHCINNCIFM
jgi:hypothetical protein